ncbi:MAG: cell envelope integrity protein CreD [Pseudomonadota bacterium]
MSLAETAREASRTPAFKFIIVCVLTLALTVPLVFVYLLVYEREVNAKRAISSVSQMWAGRQTVSGPYIVVPIEKTRDITRNGVTTTQTVRSTAAFLPEDLKVTGDVGSSVRKRGIFSVPVYRSNIGFRGRFVPPAWQRIAGEADRVLWSQAELVVLVSDVRGIKRTAEIRIDEASTKFRAGAGLRGAGVPGIHVPISEAQAKSGFAFAFDLVLSGSDELQFVPAGGETRVELKSDWPHPSFKGRFLPEARTVGESGFTASWIIPRLARGQGQEIEIANLNRLRSFQAFGVDLFQPVRFYSLAQRALKYALGFIAIAFLAVFVMEIQSRQRVHWIQYLFVGLALIIFYVLLVGTAEHVGFDFGYAGAAIATTLLIGIYFGAVTASRAYGVTMCVILGLIYALLYLLLRLEDFALLVGSIAAFLLMATVMFATRNVDWSRGGLVNIGLGEASDRGQDGPIESSSPTR